MTTGARLPFAGGLVGWAAAAGRSLAAAAGLLTRAPLVARIPVQPADLVRAAVWFPVVGGVTGLLVAGVGVAGARWWTPPLAALVAVAVETVVTGALHLDGLADTADGLAGRTREQALAIMRDHALGTYGAAAAVLTLGAKVAALSTLTTPDGVPTVVAVYAVGRAVPLPVALALPYARDHGTGRALTDGLRARHAIAGLAIAVAIATATTGLAALAVLTCLVTAAVIVVRFARTRLGGATGDVYGAAIELTTTAGLLVAVTVTP